MNPNKLNRNPSKTKSNLIKINSNPRCRANCSGPYSMRPSHICLHLSLRTQSRTNRKKYALLCVNVSGYCVQLCCPSRPQPFFSLPGSVEGGGGVSIYIYIYMDSCTLSHTHIHQMLMCLTMKHCMIHEKLKLPLVFMLFQLLVAVGMRPGVLS